MLWWTLRKLNSPQDAKRLKAVRELHGRKAPEVIAALEQRLHDRSPKIQSAAFDALTCVGALERERAIEIFKNGYTDVQLRRRAIHEAAKSRDPSVTTALLELAISQADSSDRESATAIIKEAFTALDAIDTAWKGGPLGRRLLADLWERFSAAEYLGVSRSVLPTISLIEPSWTTTPEAARTIIPLLHYVGDGSANVDWERSILIKLARHHERAIVAALASDHWLTRVGASVALRDLLNAAMPAAIPKSKNYSVFVPVHDAKDLSVTGLVAPLIEALEIPRSAKRACELLRVLLRYAPREMETAHLQAMASIRHVEAIQFEDVMHYEPTESWKIGEKEISCTIDFGPAWQAARQELRRRGIAT